MGHEPQARLKGALAGGTTVPALRGLTFVDPGLLPGAAASSPASGLARACADLGLDFAFVGSWEPWAPGAVAALEAEEVAALWVVPGVVWPSLEQLGVADGLRISVRDPERMAEAMDAALATALESAEAGIRAGASGLVVADDLAGSSGPLLSHDWLAREAFPRLARVTALARGAGLPVVLHCDGDARSLFAVAFEAGFSAVHGDCGGADGIAPALEAARTHGMALVGGLATSGLTDRLHGAIAGAEAAFLARGGGLLIADDGGLTTSRQAEALLCALAAAGRL